MLVWLVGDVLAGCVGFVKLNASMACQAGFNGGAGSFVFFSESADWGAVIVGGE